MPSPNELNLRARMEKLPAATVAGTPGTETEIIGATPCNDNGRSAAAWRIIDLYSNEGKPWEAAIEWSGGNGGRRRALVTVVQSSRVCVFAASVYVKGKALTLAAINAWVAISDGVVTSANQYSVRGEATDQTLSFDIPTPPFARFVRLEIDTIALYATSSIALTDGFGVVRNRTRGDQQPNPGLMVGDSSVVTVTLPSACKWRVTFDLNL